MAVAPATLIVDREPSKFSLRLRSEERSCLLAAPTLCAAMEAEVLCAIDIDGGLWTRLHSATFLLSCSLHDDAGCELVGFGIPSLQELEQDSEDAEPPRLIHVQ